MVLRRAFLAISVLWAFGAQAQTWPDKPIKLIVPTGAGAATDVMARVMANEVSKGIGGSMYVENIAGGSGIPAHQAVARADADGYTFLFTNTSGMALNTVTFKQLPYNPATDFMPVALVADLAPQMVSVHKDVPAKTVPELIAFVKANPGKVSYGVDATAGAAVFYGRLLNRRGGLDMAEVPYRTAAQMVQDAGAGRFQVLISSITVAQPFVDTGELRQIAVFSGRRFPTMPDVATIAETIPGAAYDGWFVVVAPVKTPPAIIDRLNKAVAEFLRTPDAQKRLHQIGLASNGTGSPQQTKEFIDKERERWRDLAKELGVEPQ